MTNIINEENISRLRVLSDAGIDVNDFLNKLLQFNHESVNAFVDVVSKIDEKELKVDLTSEFKEINTLDYWYDIDEDIAKGSIICSKKLSHFNDINDILSMKRLDFRDMINKYLIEAFNCRELSVSSYNAEFSQLKDSLYELQTNSTSILRAYKVLIGENFVNLNNYPELFVIKAEKTENAYENEYERVAFFFKEQEKVIEFIFKITHAFYLEITKKHKENTDNLIKEKEKRLSSLKLCLEDFKSLQKNENEKDFEKILFIQSKKIKYLLMSCGAIIKYKQIDDYKESLEIYTKEINVL